MNQANPTSGNTKFTTTEEGRIGEQLVAEYLMIEGYVILERNWRPSPTSKLEIDIIATMDMLVIFVEVKTRSGNSQDPIEAIDAGKISNICKAADSYLRQQTFLYEYRFDIAGVTFSQGAEPKIEYISDAFMPPFGNKA